MTSGPALRRRLLLHIALRLVAAAVLLGAALVVQLRAPGTFPINSIVTLTAAIFAVSIVFVTSLGLVERFPWLVDVHFGIDVVMVSAAVALTGGLTSLFTSLYVLPIVAASSVQFRRGALQVAALGSVMYSGVVLAQYAELTGLVNPLLGARAPVSLPGATMAQYTVGLNVLGLFAVAILSGSLAERVRRADVQLEQTSEELADLQFFSQYVIDSLVSGLATADDQNRLLTFNPSAVAITGHMAAAALGKSALDILQLPDSFVAKLKDELLRVRSKRRDLQYRRPDGTVIDLGVSVTQLPLPDGRRGYLYTFQDVTELKRLERGGQIQKRLAAVGEMAAGIAHEIRNPLASMSGSMQILRQELALSSDQAQLMDIVLKESDRLNDIVRSFLAYARPQRFELQRLDLRGLVQDTATLLRNSTEFDERHQIDVSVAPDEVWIEADENQVRQVIWNLATNGLRAMPQGGRLHLSVACEGVGGGQGGVLSVTDEGVGIAAEEIDSIFHPFRGSFQRGSGLGLAIVHRIISDYGARVEVQSQPEQGTTFRVTFPAVPADREQGRQEAARLTS
ncbi:MAG TPA: ATP-binding protein [Vicinamibacterales bacterium]|nr:ATP-binding protein [Vicinamibacterales bacterium]